MSNDNELTPPSPNKIPYVMEAHGDTRVDNYYWLRDDTRSKSEVLNYLKLENEYADSWFDNRADYKSQILDELISRVVSSETSFKIKKGDYYYFNEITSDDQLPKYYRSKNGVKELIVNPNIKLETQDYYSINSIVPSSDNSLIAFNDDDNGRREFTIRILNSDYELLDDEMTKTSYGIFWSSDNKYLIYLKKDPVTLIANQVYVHEVGTSQDEDILIYKEEDPEFLINLSQSRTDKFIYIDIEKTNANEIRLIDTSNPTLEPQIAIKRSDNHLYTLEHAADNSFYVRSNLDSPNYKIYKAANINSIGDSVDEVYAHNLDVFISDHLIFENYLILEVRENGLPGIQKINLFNNELSKITFNEDSYYVSLSYNDKVSDQDFYYSYSSPTQPVTIYSQNLQSGDTTNLWEKQVANFDSEKYVTNRKFIEARDGESIPVTITHLKDIDLENAPILFYG
ncbi:S9 family peptidase, partial [Gammaproteobacteria bacterium]|nr:S9 family peptidase [Gammaproteobacteria bacterium]